MHLYIRHEAGLQRGDLEVWVPYVKNFTTFSIARLSSPITKEDALNMNKALMKVSGGKE